MDPKPADLRSIFDGALALAPGPGREAYLDQACRDDLGLRRRVEALLAALEDAGDFLADPSAAGTAGGSGGLSETLEATGPPGPPARPARPESVGDMIGPYKLLQAIGEGGMGTVYMAEQERPVRRRVALKVIRAGMDSAQVVARFEAERQALAMMDHPNIARVLDAGATLAGRPFFVMELVKGVPITRYCDEARLSAWGRLGLFVEVCRAVQHAHQKGIIHRDLKPSNVLVTRVDGRPVPKVIDFGVAKAVDQRLTERTLVTQFGAIVGTPEYMSPEQAAISGVDVDTRSDVYSLGVLLYELLTGSTPLDLDAAKQAAFSELLRRIREEEPARPSARLSRSGERLSTLSALRDTDPSRLTRFVRGDLDWIAMKALEKDRSRRYETAAALARDVERYLAGDAVEARPPSAAYRFAKFARKHRAALAAGGAFLILLATATAVSVSQAVRATRARREAEAVSRFLLDVFREPDPTRRGPSLKVSEFLDEAARRLDADETLSAPERAALDDLLRRISASAGPGRPLVELLQGCGDRLAADRSLPPLTKASLLFALGGTFSALNEFGPSERMYRECYAIRERWLGPADRATLAARIEATSLVDSGVNAESVAWQREALRACEQALGPDDELSVLARKYLIETLANIDPAEAVALAKANLDWCAARHGPSASLTRASRFALSVAFGMAGRHDEALAEQRAVVEAARESLGPDHPETLRMLLLLLKHQATIGALDEAGRTYRALRDGQDRRLGPDHPQVFDAMQAYSDGLDLDGRRAEAVALRREARDRGLAVLDPDSLRAHMLRLPVAYDDVLLGGKAAAVAELESLRAAMRTGYREDSYWLLQTERALAEAYFLAGRREDAIRLLRDVIRRGEEAWGARDIAVLDNRLLLGDAHFYAADFAEALAECRRVEAEALAMGEAGEIYLAAVRYLEAAIDAAQRPSPEAVARLAEAVGRQGRFYKPGSRPVLVHRLTLADAAFSAGLHDQAAAAWEGVREGLLPEVARMAAWAGMDSRLGSIDLDRGEFERAEPRIVGAYEACLADADCIPPLYRGRPAEVAARVIRLYEEWGRPEEAARWSRRIAEEVGAVD